jgi:hypothetical protein
VAIAAVAVVLMVVWMYVGGRRLVEGRRKWEERRRGEQCDELKINMIM